MEQMLPIRILLAEDSPADVWLITEALKRQSLVFAIDHYSTAEQAIAAVLGCGRNGFPVPDLILLDYNLPQGHGGDILAAAAGNPHLSKVPKAILTSWLRPVDADRSRQLGATCLITKPATLEDFLELVGTRVARLLKRADVAATP
jgi:chemotaxis family two-component system response regulator Rcp1